MIALEFKQAWREAGVQFVLIALFAVLCAALWQGHAQVMRNESALMASVQHEQDAMHTAASTALALDAGTLDKANVPRDPRDVASFGGQQIVTYARLPQAPLAAISFGQSDLFPAYVALTTGSRDKTLGSAELVNPEAQQAGPLDTAFVLVYLLPLAVIILGHSIRAAEREAGMDVLIRTAVLRPWRVYARRLFLRVALLYAVVMLALLAAALSGALLGNAWFDLLILAVLIAPYLLFWYAVVLAVAVSASSSAISALRSITVWLVVLVLIPAAANVAARLLAPVPARAEFVQAVRDATDAVETQRAQLLEKYLFDHPEMTEGDAAANVVPAAIASLVTRRAVEARAAEVEARYQAQLRHQESVIASFEYVAPGIWLQNALNRLAGADAARYRQFQSAVAGYHEELRDFFELLLRKGTPPVQAVASHAGAGSATQYAHFNYPVFTTTVSRHNVLTGASSIVTLSFMLLTSAALLFWTRRHVQ